MVLPQFVDKRFQVLFTPLTGVLFTFPSRYWFTIGRSVVFSLGRWSSQIPTGFHVSRGTWEFDQERATPFVYRTITFYCWTFQTIQLGEAFVTLRGSHVLPRPNPATPAVQRTWT